MGLIAGGRRRRGLCLGMEAEGSGDGEGDRSFAADACDHTCQACDSAHCHGLDLLAYRSNEDVPALIKAVCAAVSKPVYVAGSIDTPERMGVVKEAGAAGFTIGTAALDTIAEELPKTMGCSGLGPAILDTVADELPSKMGCSELGPAILGTVADELP